MSRAFTREQDGDSSLTDIGERPVSQHRNLVTRRGLALIDAEIASLREALARAEADAESQTIALVSRDLRYWNARRETAELAEPDPGEEVVRFGMRVTLVDEADRSQVWTIVGEDEADAATGTISHASPLAQALFGLPVGSLVTVNGREWQIAGIETA
jgi:transcription elongation GreA/GreB family factor